MADSLTVTFLRIARCFYLPGQLGGSENEGSRLQCCLTNGRDRTVEKALSLLGASAVM